MDTFVNQAGRINLNTQCQRSPDTFPFNERKESAEDTMSIAFTALRLISIRTQAVTKNIGGNKQIISTIIRSRESTSLSADSVFQPLVVNCKNKMIAMFFILWSNTPNF